jgi:hypothetical protein
LFGLSRLDELDIVACWPYGFVRVDPVTPAAVAYVAGYTTKKASEVLEERGDRVDERTGEIYRFQPSFLQMSRRPGIGGKRRDLWRSWRSAAVVDGVELPVPRYLHQAYLDNCSPRELASLEDQRSVVGVSAAELEAGAAIARSRMAVYSDQRRKL